MNEPEWAVVLDFVYSRNQDSFPVLISEEHPVVENTDLSEDEVEENFRVLEKWDLVDTKLTLKGEIAKERTGRVPAEQQRYELTEKGFDVAHDREQKQRSQRNNQNLVTLTWVLAGTAMIQALAAIYSVGQEERPYVAGASGILLITILVGIRITGEGPIVPTQ